MMEQQQVSKRQAGLIRLRQCGKCQQGKLKAAAESHVAFNHHLVSGYWTACEPEHHHILLMGFNRMKVNGKDYPIYYGNIENAPKYQPENIFGGGKQHIFKTTDLSSARLSNRHQPNFWSSSSHSLHHRPPDKAVHWGHRVPVGIWNVHWNVPLIWVPASKNEEFSKKINLRPFRLNWIPNHH